MNLDLYALGSICTCHYLRSSVEAPDTRTIWHLALEEFVTKEHLAQEEQFTMDHLSQDALVTKEYLALGACVTKVHLAQETRVT